MDFKNRPYTFRYRPLLWLRVRYDLAWYRLYDWANNHKGV